MWITPNFFSVYRIWKKTWVYVHLNNLWVLWRQCLTGFSALFFFYFFILYILKFCISFFPLFIEFSTSIWEWTSVLCAPYCSRYSTHYFHYIVYVFCSYSYVHIHIPPPLFCVTESVVFNSLWLFYLMFVSFIRDPRY